MAMGTSNVMPGVGGGGFGLGGMMAVSSIFQSISQIYLGGVANDIAGYNAKIIESKLRLIQIQKDIEKGQYTRAKGRMVSTGFTKMAGAGVGPSGSPIAVMTRNFTQMSIDEAIGQFNFDMQKSYTRSEADQERMRGRSEKSAYYSKAFSTLLKGSKDFALYKYGINLSGGAQHA